MGRLHPRVESGRVQIFSLPSGPGRRGPIVWVCVGHRKCYAKRMVKFAFSESLVLLKLFSV